MEVGVAPVFFERTKYFSCAVTNRFIFIIFRN